MESFFPEFISPETKEPLILKEEKLVSPAGKTFPVLKQIPRFISSFNYAEAFGVQWNKYRQTQLDSHTKIPLSETRLRRCLGEEAWGSLSEKTVLEAGCGAGRFTEVLLKKKARVFSVDLSGAVEANQINFPQTETHRIAQANILELPFNRQQFDIVLCLGVLQHTPNPEETIQRLSEHVKPRGLLVIDHYRFDIWNYLKVAFFLRLYLKRLRPENSMRITEKLVKTFLPLHRFVRFSRVLEFLLSRFSPVLTYYRIFPELSEALQKEWAFLDTYDSLTDYYKHMRTKSQIRKALERARMQVLYCEYGGNGVEARARA
ncbi:MAG: bioC [Bacteriovoracaceae bacterium]|nr:bioC [Bacteriovoracaceae bacterium]